MHTSNPSVVTVCVQIMVLYVSICHLCSEVAVIFLKTSFICIQRSRIEGRKNSGDSTHPVFSEYQLLT